MSVTRYLTIAERSEGLYKEKGSRFLAFAFPVCSPQDVKEILLDLKKKYYDATHHCYAYIIGADGSSFRMNDDGEPSSTAGKPIYGQLLSKNLKNVLIVVVRYFGGTKLGVSGLIKAYRMAAAECLNNALIIERKVRRVFHLSFPYEKMNVVMSTLKQYNVEQRNHCFDLECSIEIVVDSDISSDFERSVSLIENVKCIFFCTE